MTKWWLLAITLALWTFGCGKKAQRQDEQPTEVVADEPVDLDAVDSEKLGSAPCGNPDWSQMPPSSSPESR